MGKLRLVKVRESVPGHTTDGRPKLFYFIPKPFSFQTLGTSSEPPHNGCSDTELGEVLQSLCLSQGGRYDYRDAPSNSEPSISTSWENDFWSQGVTKAGMATQEPDTSSASQPDSALEPL